MNIVINDLNANDSRTKRLIDFLDLNFFDWQEQAVLPQADELKQDLFRTHKDNPGAETVYCEIV